MAGRRTRQSLARSGDGVIFGPDDRLRVAVDRLRHDARPLGPNDEMNAAEYIEQQYARMVLRLANLDEDTA